MDEPIVCGVESAKYGASFGFGLGDRDLLHDQPLDPMGDRPWDPKLAVRRLFRAVSSLTASDAPQ